MHPPPFNLSQHRLSDWPECTLELRCRPCRGRMSTYPLKLLRMRYGDVLIWDVVRRLRCRECRRVPRPIYLVAGHHRSSEGGPGPDWAVELVGEGK